MTKDDLISRQPETHDKRTETHSCDSIDRQAAIDFIAAGHLCNPNEPRWSDNEVVNFLKSRPSAQRTGRWIENSGNIACSECHIIWLHRRTAFCPNCGCAMKEGDAE